MGKIGLNTGLTLYKSVFDTIYHGGNYGQTSGEDGWTDYRQAFHTVSPLQ